MRKNRLYIFLLALLSVTTVFADNMPTINPTAIFTTADGEETGTSYSGSAPLPVRFFANAENTSGWDTYYEWRFTLEGQEEPYLKRYEQDRIYLRQSRFTQGCALCRLHTKRRYRGLHR